MNTKLQNKAWSVLPKEFKKELNEIYFNAVVYHPCGYNHKTDLLKYLFGYHNLTSDAEEEEMLTCEKSKVQRAYNTSREIVKAENPDSLMYSMHTQIMCVLENIFGSKCLPDKESKPAKPKEDKHFDNILKDDFHDHNRLHIAAMAMQGILSNADRMKGYEYVATTPPCEELEVVVARKALRYADALISECKKGDKGK